MRLASCYKTDMRVEEIRLLNLQKLVAEMKTSAAVAKAASTAPSYISQILTRAPSRTGKPRDVGSDLARKLESGCGKPVGWMDSLHDGDEALRAALGPAITTPQRPVVVVESDEDIQHEVFAIPRYRVKASAGSGEPVFEIDTEGTPNYCRSGWALKNGFKPDSLFSIVAAGDSMEPTIPDGASLIVHRTSEIANGKVHVICRGTQCYVKRLFAQMDGSVLVRSDNQDIYKDLTVSPDDTDALHVVGLVVSVSFNL